MKLISKALVEFQSKLKPVNKDSVNPFFKSNYLSLSGILENVMPLLTSNGLAISQVMSVNENNTLMVTRLIHESGEMLESTMLLPIVNDPQKLGSLVTYYKRYQLQAMLGICSVEDDDDAQIISNQYQNKPATVKVSSPFGYDPATAAQKQTLKRFYPDMDMNELSKESAKKLFDDMNKRK
jgi:hypothetical protein